MSPVHRSAVDVHTRIMYWPRHIYKGVGVACSHLSSNCGEDSVQDTRLLQYQVMGLDARRG
jgi:hypothetical protein